jgi:NADH-quinone oxidoreductase subunit M
MMAILSILILVPILVSPIVYILTRYIKKIGIIFSVAVSVFLVLLSLYVVASIYTNRPGPNSYAFVERFSWISYGPVGVDYYVGADGLSSPLILLSSILTLLVIFGSRNLIEKNEAEYYSLIFLFEGAIMGVFLSLNLIFFYIFWELVLIPMFFFIGIWGGPRRKYAAMKFIIFTFVGSTVMLLGFLYVYLASGLQSFNIPELSGKVPEGLQFIPLILTFLGFGVKLPVFPFHTWLPDAHVEAPSPISVLLAGVLLKMGGYGFLRISLGLFPQAASQYSSFFITLSIISMFYAAFVAMLQKDLKRMVAYTSINHMGFVMLGSFSTAVSGSLLGIDGALLQMFTHGLAIGSLFMLTGYIQHQAGTREIQLLKGLRETMPRTAILLVLGSWAAMALPPFASFLAEFMVIAAAVAAYPLASVSVLVPVITAGYFLWMIKRTVLSKIELHDVHDMSIADMLSFIVYLAPLVIVLVFSFLITDPLTPVAQFLAGLR